MRASFQLCNGQNGEAGEAVGYTGGLDGELRQEKGRSKAGGRRRGVGMGAADGSEAGAVRR